MENDVIRLAGELSVAVEVIMDPNVSQQARMDAYIACEKYGTTLSGCDGIGISHELPLSLSFLQIQRYVTVLCSSRPLLGQWSVQCEYSALWSTVDGTHGEIQVELYITGGKDFHQGE